MAITSGCAISPLKILGYMQPKELKPHIDAQRYEEVLNKLSIQVTDAAEWPQVCLPYFQQFSRLPIPGLPGSKPEYCSKDMS